MCINPTTKEMTFVQQLYAKLTIIQKPDSWYLDYISPDFIKMTGHSMQEIKIQFSSQFIRLFTPDAAQTLNHLLDGLSAEELLFPGTFKLSAAAGQTIHVLLQALPLEPRNGQKRAAINMIYVRQYQEYCCDSEEPEPTASQENHAISRDWLLDESNDIIYVADFYSYDLLYMNNGCRTSFHLQGESYKGQKCYKVLQGLDEPCSFCTNHLLNRDSFYTWQYHNPLINQTLQLKDRLVDWYGRPARIEFATDITEVDKKTRFLEKQIKIDQAVIGCYRSLNSSVPLKQAANDALGVAGDFYQADRVFLLVKDPKTNDHCISYMWTRQNIAEQKLTEIELNYVMKVLEEKTRGDIPYKMNDRSLLQDSDPILYQLCSQYGIDNQRILTCYVSGMPVGFIGMDNPFRMQDELTMLETLGYCMAEEISRRQLANQLNYLGHHDVLTGLRNRNSFAAYMEKLLSAPFHSLGVIAADLNSLSEINRLRGYAEGDFIVKSTAKLLRNIFPEKLIFRLNGDEFLAFYENCSKEKLLSRIQRLNEESKEIPSNGISVGYAWSDQKSSFTQLITQANELMQIHKQSYYQNVEHLPVMGRYGHRQIQPLLTAIHNGWYKLYLQPKVDCVTGVLTGAEALARYDSPTDGFKMPAQFIPEMEQNYTIKYLDLYIFEEVCRTLERWKKEGKPPLTVSVNLSRLTLLEPGLMQAIQNIADSHQVPRVQIELEITESMGTYEDKVIAEMGTCIKDSGFRLALDDFGSQYTNMSILVMLPPDTLKIDRSLVQDLLGNRSNKILLQHLFAFCREMGIRSVMEGVEKKEQLDLLKTLRCDEIQGYLFGKPLTLEHFETQFL